MRSAFALALAAALAVGCNILAAADGADAGDGDDGDDDIGSDAGDGSGTIDVDAHVEGEAGESTHMEVELQVGGAPLSGAIVVFDSELGAVTLAETAAGIYTGSQSGFASAYALEVTAGEDFATGSLASPTPHEITAPAAGGTYDAAGGAGDPLLVEWSPTGADAVQVRSDDAELELAGDPGQAEIAASYFEDEDDRIEVRRANSIELAGGAGSSSLEVSYEARRELAVTNPVVD